MTVQEKVTQDTKVGKWFLCQAHPPPMPPRWRASLMPGGTRSAWYHHYILATCKALIFPSSLQWCGDTSYNYSPEIRSLVKCKHIHPHGSRWGQHRARSPATPSPATQPCCLLTLAWGCPSDKDSNSGDTYLWADIFLGWTHNLKITWEITGQAFKEVLVFDTNKLFCLEKKYIYMEFNLLGHNWSFKRIWEQRECSWCETKRYFLAVQRGMPGMDWRAVSG